MYTKNKKGQAAMEFLMTYGWAILAAIVVIAVLAIYFRPSTLVTGSTFVTAPFYAVGSTISPAGMLVEIKNNGGETNTVIGYSVTGSSITCATNTTTNRVLTSGSSTILNVSCSAGLTTGQTVSGSIVIDYNRTGSSLAQKSTGSVAGTVA